MKSLRHPFDAAGNQEEAALWTLDRAQRDSVEHRSMMGCKAVKDSLDVAFEQIANQCWFG
jgi:hypothetical protein